MLKVSPFINTVASLLQDPSPKSIIRVDKPCGVISTVPLVIHIHDNSALRALVIVTINELPSVVVPLALPVIE
jgi:hypothetical protein